MAEGRLTGGSEGFGTNGGRAFREHFRDGLAHGLRTRWHANGQVSSEADVVDGKWHGMFRRWDEQGAMTEEVEMRDGEADGIGRSYYPSGFVKAEAEVRRGQPVWEKTWADGEHPGPGTRIASLPVAPTGP